MVNDTFAFPVEPCDTDTLTELVFTKFREFAVIAVPLFALAETVFPLIDDDDIVSSGICSLCVYCIYRTVITTNPSDPLSPPDGAPFPFVPLPE